MGKGSFEELMFGVRRARRLMFAATASFGERRVKLLKEEGIADERKVEGKKLYEVRI